jgi:RHS repeat-associated protein
MIYQNGSLKEILTPEGYIENGVYYYYLQDHQGNNRVVINSSGAVQEYSHYYSDGMRYIPESSTNAAAIPYRYNNKEFEAMNGLNQYDYGARRRGSGIPVFPTQDRFEEKFPWQSPYCYAGNNPVLNIDQHGDSAWSVKRDWNETDTEKFAEFAQQRLKDYEGENIDCADLSLSVLIDYASANGLPLDISTADGKTFDSNSDKYNSVDDYKNGYSVNGKKEGGVLPNVGAKDISSNTQIIDKKEAQSGDMIILTAPADHIANYSQITPERKLTYGNLNTNDNTPSQVKTTNDWSNATKEGDRPGRPGRPIKYNPDTKHAHRWKVLMSK